MTNQEIDQLVFRGQRQSLLRFLVKSPLSSLSSFLCVVALLLILFTVLAHDYVMAGGTFCLFAVYVAAVARKHVKSFGRYRGTHFWDFLADEGISGRPVEAATARLIRTVARIQRLPRGLEMLPMRQAVRLIETYQLQQLELRRLNARSHEWRTLRRTLSEKLAQLRGIGEDHREGQNRLAEIDVQCESLHRLQQPIEDSCTRLELIVISVEKAVLSRQLRAEIGTLNEGVTGSDAPTEPAFEAQSLEEIERQIGREIETYLRLERETDEYLR